MNKQRETGAQSITVIGSGYLGATHAVCMAELGCRVLAVDVDETKISRLAAGDAPFFEPGLEPLLRKNLEAGRLHFTTSYDEVAEFGDVHFLCVNTPQQDNSDAADLSYLDAAVAALAPRLRRDCLVVGKSTVPVGTAVALAKMLVRLAPAGARVQLAWNPEFLREGYGVEDTLRPDRLVFGVTSLEAEARLRRVFAPIIEAGTPVVITDYATAELVKVAANSFLATKISFINAMAEVCEAAGADVLTLAAALGQDPRIGPRFLQPGVGFGGGCLPKDIRAFAIRADELGVGPALSFLQEIDAINLRRRGRIVDLVRAAAGGTLEQCSIAMLGAAFKPNSDDVRDSPALAVAATLHQLGAAVTVYDPVANDNARRVHPQLKYADSVSAAMADVGAVVVLTEWDQFAELDPVALANLVRRRAVVDGRHCLDGDRWRDAGWEYHAPGRPGSVPMAPAAVPTQRTQRPALPPLAPGRTGAFGRSSSDGRR
ncbi:UDP-glucose dehydrogenase family protein [Parafrankia sp. FMc2]|uniref:UDP-glucose dehydrogenase family protein n=1 Tax=Parafrankia sp. FMc2 TaxID=3233196 RepID=UPI0034D68CE7